MSVVANVAINVDASKALTQIRSVDTAVDNLAKSAAGIPSKIGSGIDGLGGKMQALGGKFATLGGAVASLGAGAALKGFLDAGVAAERTGKTIKALAGDLGEVAGVNKIASNAAKEFGLGQTTAAKSVADLYGRLRPMGISLKDIGGTFNGVNKAAGLMNLTAADTEGVLLQLSQAMGSGRLQGDELRSVMERLPAVGQAIAKVMGVQVGDIKQLGADGLITTDIIIKAMAELDKLKPPPPDAVKLYTAAVEDLQTSIGTKLMPVFTPFLQALTGLINGFSALPQPVQNVVVAIGGLVAVIALVAAPLGFLISGIGSLVTALAAANIGGLIAGWLPVLSGFLTWVGSTFIPGLLAFFSGPVGWTVLAIAAVVALGVAFRKPLTEFANWLWKWGEPIRKFWIDLWNKAIENARTSFSTIGNAFKAVAQAFNTAIINPIRNAWEGLMQLLPKALSSAAATIKSTFSQVGSAIKSILNAVMRSIFSGVNKAIDNINSLINRANAISAKVKGPQLPTIPKLAVPQFAEGGVVTKPTLAVVGEGGEPEYIIPESKMAATAASYLNGARGDSAIASSGAKGSDAGGSTTINIQTGPVVEMNGERYVTMGDFERGLRQVAGNVYKGLRTPAGRYAVGTR
jgi:tape measure domain-containing protein